MPELAADTGALHTNMENQPAVGQQAFVTQVSQGEPRKISQPLLIGLILVGVVIGQILISLLLVATQKSALKTQETKIQRSQQEITGPLSSIDAQVTQITNGLKVYASLNMSQKDFGALWDDLSKRVVANTRYKTVTIDPKGMIKIDGEARTFQDIAKLIASLNKTTTVKNVSLISTNSNETTKDFSLSAKFISAQSKETSNE